jgi:hypothetical protein
MTHVGETFPEIELIRRPRSVEAERLMRHEYAPVGVGDRNKLGGHPDWVQGEEWPECCGKRMTFYGQLDSVGDDIHLGDCGLIYVFVCFDCFSTKSLMQFS